MDTSKLVTVFVWATVVLIAYEAIKTVFAKANPLGVPLAGSITPTAGLLTGSNFADQELQKASGANPLGTVVLTGDAYSSGQSEGWNF